MTTPTPPDALNASANTITIYGSALVDACRQAADSHALDDLLRAIEAFVRKRPDDETAKRMHAHGVKLRAQHRAHTLQGALDTLTAHIERNR